MSSHTGVKRRSLPDFQPTALLAGSRDTTFYGDLYVNFIVARILVTMDSMRPYDIIYYTAIVQHLRTIEHRYHGLIRTTIAEQLRFTPLVGTRSRKPLTPPVAFGVR